MSGAGETRGVEADITAWRAAMTHSGAVATADADELEGHLREQVADLEAVGLSDDEAFLVAVKRLGQVDAITAEFAREHGERLWKQLLPARVDQTAPQRASFVRMLGFAAGAALFAQVLRLAGGFPDAPADWLWRSAGVIGLLPLVVWFAVVRRISVRRAVALGAIVVVGTIAVTAVPFAPDSDTGALAAAHLVAVMWCAVGIAAVGGDLRSSEGRMHVVRFSGEWVVYMTLIALGGGVLLALTALVLAPIAGDAIDPVFGAVLPSAVAAAVIVAAWLVEAKQRVIENIAPVLTAIFTPLFAVMLAIASVVYLSGGVTRAFDRDLLIVFDVLLVVVLALVLYGLSARDPRLPAGAMDAIRFVTVVFALLLDAIVLTSMVARIGEFGFTPNRTVALGLNVLLVVNLVVTAVLSLRLLFGRTPAMRIERWQMAYLPAFGVWAAAVVVVVPPLFGFA